MGKRRIELAEEALGAFFAVRDAIAFIRNPWSSGNEGNSREKRDSETSEETKLLNRAYIVYERYQAKQETFARFDTIKYRFMAAFGKDTEAIFEKTGRTLHKIFVAAHMLGTYYWPRQGRVPMEEAEFKKHLDEMHKNEGIFWGRLSKDDIIQKDLDEILTLLESVAKPCFEGESTLYRTLTRNLFKRN